MTNAIKRIAVLGGLTVAALGVTPAFASGTASGTDILNTATVDYNVGTVAQTQKSASDTFKVDRKATVLVTETGSATTAVSANQTVAVTTFTVTNQSNATIDIGLAAGQFAGGSAPHGGTDAFDLTGLGMFVDTNGNGSYDAGTDLAVTFLDELAADATRTVFIVGTIPGTVTNGQIAAVHLTGTAREGGGAATQGLVITATGGANTAGTVDTVLQDTGTGINGDIANDGKSTDDDDYTVSAANLTVTKLSRVIEDPVNTIASGNAANAKAIPGATIEYCIVVANAAGASTASSVVINDNLTSLPVTYSSAFGVFEGGSVASSVCSGGTGTGTYNAGTKIVNGNLGTITAGQTKTVYFRATIN
jgi:hypothetical protein